MSSACGPVRDLAHHGRGGVQGHLVLGHAHGLDAGRTAQFDHGRVPSADLDRPQARGGLGDVHELDARKLRLPEREEVDGDVFQTVTCSSSNPMRSAPPPNRRTAWKSLAFRQSVQMAAPKVRRRGWPPSMPAPIVVARSWFTTSPQRRPKGRRLKSTSW